MQQGDPLGPLLFSLVVLQLLDTIGPIDGLFLHVWYLDDGTFVGTRDAVSSFLISLINNGPSFGLKLNLKKCEVCWPSGDQSFPRFPSQIRRICIEDTGVELLGSPVCGTDDFYSAIVGRRVDSVLENQSFLPELNNPKSSFIYFAVASASARSTILSEQFLRAQLITIGHALTPGHDVL